MARSGKTVENAAMLLNTMISIAKNDAKNIKTCIGGITNATFFGNAIEHIAQECCYECC